MLSKHKRKLIAGLLSFLLATLQISGWQFSMKYGTSIHIFSPFKISEPLSVSQCIIAGLAVWMLWGLFIYACFSRLEKNSRKTPAVASAKLGHLWLYATLILFAVYLACLIGCYPGFYCYDMGNQLPQIMYQEVPFDAHHPLLHTIVGGGIITLGYRLYDVDLTFGVFLYNVVQMGICALCFGYGVRFVYRVSRKRVLTVLSLLFYALCPSIVIFAMTTTKDVSCYAILLVACLKQYDLCQYLQQGRKVKKSQWLCLGCLLLLSCLLRKNNIYALAVFAVIQMLLFRKQLYQLLAFYLCTILLFFGIHNGMILCLDAEKGSVTEALSIPFQQMARLYADYGEAAFSDEELALLYDVIEPSMLSTYDPMISDSVKFAFWRHLDTLMEKKWDYLSLWIKKGIEYPKTYLLSFAENTYQAWYPWTELADTQNYRYFDLTTWNLEYKRPKCPPLYNFYVSLIQRKYINVPVLRLSFSIGAMLWFSLAAFFYGLWQENRPAVTTLLLVLLVCATCMCGPVSDLRYYLILFYMFPVAVVFLLHPKTEHMLNYQAAKTEDSQLCVPFPAEDSSGAASITCPAAPFPILSE